MGENTKIALGKICSNQAVELILNTDERNSLPNEEVEQLDKIGKVGN